MPVFYDRAEIRDGRARITPEGYFVADALVGRANNIQDYRAGELGEAFADRDPFAIVKVFRPETEVFAVDSLKTASRLPITMDHPPGVMVDATNWREYAKGESGESIMRDGEFIRVPIRVTDAAAVSSVQADRREFSLGYSAEISVQDGEYNGEHYDAILSNIRYNHLAACRVARGGPELRITDERPARPIEGDNPMPKIVLIDNLPVDVSNADVAEQTVTRLVSARDTAVQGLDAAQETIAARDATIAARDAEISTLRDEVASAKLTPAQLRDAAAAFARTSAKAAAMGVTVTDDMDVGAIRRAAVVAKMGDSAAAYTDAQVDAAFDVLAAGVKVGDEAPAADPLRAALQDGAPAGLGDMQAAFADARAKRFERFENGHRERGNTAA